MGTAMEDLHVFILIVVCPQIFDSINRDWLVVLVLKVLSIFSPDHFACKMGLQINYIYKIIGVYLQGFDLVIRDWLEPLRPLRTHNQSQQKYKLC
jgi:hypothetical protein